MIRQLIGTLAIICNLALVTSSCYATQKISDPLKIALPVTPNLVHSDRETDMDISKLMPYVTYNISCSLTTSTDNSPFYIIRNYKIEGGTSLDIFVDGISNNKANQATIPKAGNHAVNFLVENINPPDTPANILMHNASSGDMSITNCFAMIGT